MVHTGREVGGINTNYMHSHMHGIGVGTERNQLYKKWVHLCLCKHTRHTRAGMLYVCTCLYGFTVHFIFQCKHGVYMMTTNGGCSSHIDDHWCIYASLSGVTTGSGNGLAAVCCQGITTSNTDFLSTLKKNYESKDQAPLSRKCNETFVGKLVPILSESYAKCWPSYFILNVSNQWQSLGHLHLF